MQRHRRNNGMEYQNSFADHTLHLDTCGIQGDVMNTNHQLSLIVNWPPLVSTPHYWPPLIIVNWPPSVSTHLITDHLSWLSTDHPRRLHTSLLTTSHDCQLTTLSVYTPHYWPPLMIVNWPPLVSAHLITDHLSWLSTDHPRCLHLITDHLSWLSTDHPQCLHTSLLTTSHDCSTDQPSVSTHLITDHLSWLSTDHP